MSEFRYFSLPGSDMLDVRLLHDEICAPKRTRLRFLGFDENAAPGTLNHSRLNSALAGMRQLEWVAEESDVIPDSLLALTGRNSLARRRVEASPGFHAINIDLCGGVASQGMSEAGRRLFGALGVLLEAQSRTPDEGVIFLTTRFDATAVSPDVLPLLEDLVNKSLSDCSEFSTDLLVNWPECDGAKRWDDLIPLSQQERFLLGFAQWLSKRSVDFNIRARVSSMMTYRIRPEGEADDMVSIAFRLSPDRAQSPDSAGIGLSAGEASPELRWCAAIAELPRHIRTREAVDDKLRNDELLASRLGQETKKLLGGLGYDIASYDDWESKELRQHHR